MIFIKEFLSPFVPQQIQILDLQLRSGSPVDSIAASASVASVFVNFLSRETDKVIGGIVTMRAVDPGAFAAPGAPLITVQDGSALRISVSAAGDAIRTLTRGQTLAATIGGAPATAVIEGIVPAGAGNLFTVNATVANRADAYRSGSAAVLLIPVGRQHALLVPNAAIVREGDLTGVVVRTASGDERRWIRLGVSTATHTEASSGLKAGETIVVPLTQSSSAPAAL